MLFKQAGKEIIGIMKEYFTKKYPDQPFNKITVDKIHEMDFIAKVAVKAMQAIGVLYGRPTQIEEFPGITYAGLIDHITRELIAIIEQEASRNDTGFYEGAIIIFSVFLSLYTEALYHPEKDMTRLIGDAALRIKNSTAVSAATGADELRRRLRKMPPTKFGTKSIM